jgi:hypothetical protein
MELRTVSPDSSVPDGGYLLGVATPVEQWEVRTRNSITHRNRRWGAARELIRRVEMETNIID